MTLSEDKKKELVRIANEARKWAYVPYSKYAVGAALLTKSGRVYDGVNVENAAYPVTICAERTAVFKAVSSGEREFLAIAVVTRNGGMPCGSCRQVMVEFSPEMSVIVADEAGDIKSELKLSDLLPGAFRSDSLS